MSSLNSYIEANKVRNIGIFFILSMVLTHVCNILEIESIGKLFSGLFLWLCVFIFPFKYVKKNDFRKATNVILSFLFIYTSFEVIRSILTPAPNTIGNKWVSLFGNEYFMFMMLAPLMIYLGASVGSVSIVKKSVCLYLVIGTFFLLLGKVNIQYIVYYIFVLIPFISKKYYPFVVLAIGVCVYSIFSEDTSRTMLVFLVLSIFFYFLVHIIKSKKIIAIVCYSLIIIPLVYAVLSVLDPNFSVFSIILSSLMEHTSDGKFTADTRTFLFVEVAEDLTENNDWLLGKGAYSFYFSEYFLRSASGEGDHYIRVIPEVTFLAFLLRGGIIYIATFYTLLLSIVRNALKNANNNFVISVALMSSMWVFVSCFSHLSGCDFHHYVVYTLIGTCASRHWQDMTDNEVCKLLSHKVKI